MARWKNEPSATFGDMPAELSGATDDAAKRERNDWLEEHNLALVDYMSWKRERDPLSRLRPPSRRKWLSPEQQAELDREREEEEIRW